MKIDEIKSHKIFRHRLVIDFQYNRLSSIIGFIDWLGRDKMRTDYTV